MAVKQLKKQLIASILSVAVAFVALASSTYAWYVSNNTVDATTSTIAAKTDNFVLQVAKLTEGAQHGTNQSLVASSIGHKISPSSTNDLKDWYASLTWGQDGLVHSYMQADVNETGEYTRDKTGTYTIDPARYAFIKSEYVIYTVTQTGTCDVYILLLRTEYLLFRLLRQEQLHPILFRNLSESVLPCRIWMEPFQAEMKN